MPLNNVMIVGLDVEPTSVKLNEKLIPFSFYRHQLTLENLNVDLKSKIEITWE